MKLWYVVELRAEWNRKIGNPISAEIISTEPRRGDGYHEWRDTDRVENGVYIRESWCRTKAVAESTKKYWMAKPKPEL